MDDPQRAGRFIQQSTGYKAFIPAPLPPEPPLAYSGPLQTLLSQADRHIGRLDALASMLPNPDLFVAMYVRHEAVLSSQIEGTQSTLEDVLAFEADASRDDTPKDVEEVVNYVRAMNHGLERLSELPLSLRLLREIHAELMTGVRQDVAIKIFGENIDTLAGLAPKVAKIVQSVRCNVLSIKKALADDSCCRSFFV